MCVCVCNINVWRVVFICKCSWCEPNNFCTGHVTYTDMIDWLIDWFFDFLIDWLEQFRPISQLPIVQQARLWNVLLRLLRGRLTSTCLCWHLRVTSPYDYHCWCPLLEELPSTWTMLLRSGRRHTNQEEDAHNLSVQGNGHRDTWSGSEKVKWRGGRGWQEESWDYSLNHTPISGAGQETTIKSPTTRVSLERESGSRLARDLSESSISSWRWRSCLSPLKIKLRFSRILAGKTSITQHLPKIPRVRSAGAFWDEYLGQRTKRLLKDSHVPCACRRGCAYAEENSVNACEQYLRRHFEKVTVVLGKECKSIVKDRFTKMYTNCIKVRYLFTRQRLSATS